MKRFISVIATLVLVASLVFIMGAPASASTSTYTNDTDFGPPAVSNNVVTVGTGEPAYLQLDDTVTPFDFIWVAVSSRGTVVKIDTNTGIVLGEYWTSDQGAGGNPSRTTVDNNGNVWVANRSISPGTIIHIASVPTDVDNDGVIETSTGLGDILAWGTDEAVLHYVTVNSSGTRHLSVDANNNVWVSGTGYRIFDLVNGSTGAIMDTQGPTSPAYGGYGGLMDPNGVIWSARSLLRWDTADSLTGPNGDNWTGYSHDSYGLGIDSSGNVWNTALNGDTVRKFAPDGVLSGTYSHGNYYAQGVVAGLDDHIWVAHSFLGSSNSVGHILNDGTYIGNVVLDSNTNAGATGVAVDANGKIWATGYHTGKAYRIDPTAGATGADGVTPIGAVDLEVPIGGILYNYSDMTGSTLIAPPDNGMWTVVNDSVIPGAKWTTISWTAGEPGDSSIDVFVASSPDNITFGPLQQVANSQNMQTVPVPDGQYLKIVVKFTRSSTDADGDGIKESPILYDLTVAHNQPPIADAGTDQTVEQTSWDGAEVILDGSASTDDGFIEPLTYSWSWDGCLADGMNPTVLLPLGDTEITLTVYDGQFSDDDTVLITVEDTTPPEVMCVESVNPHGNIIPGKNRDSNGKDKKNINPDGFYEIIAEDICDAEPDIYIGTVCNPYMFGPFVSGVVLKFTEAPGADPRIQKIGSTNDKADSVKYHIILPSDPVVTVVDNSGNVAICSSCLVPPPPM